MKTTQYNPSQIEVELAKALLSMQGEIEKHLSSNKIISMENRIDDDNPSVTLHLEDEDGDPHQVVVRLIQKPDTF